MHTYVFVCEESERDVCVYMYVFMQSCRSICMTAYTLQYCWRLESFTILEIDAKIYSKSNIIICVFNWIFSW